MKPIQKTLATFALAGLLLGIPTAALADDTVTVTVPEFPVTLNGISIDQANSQYPSILYKNITYVPMTYYDAKLLGLNPNWSQETGLSIKLADFIPSQETAQAAYQPYKIDSKNGQTYTAVKPTFAITVNGKAIDNSREEYPLLVFRDVTYFPLTWRFAVDEFGWKYTFDLETGLQITPVPTPVILDNSFGTNEEVTVTGDGVNLRAGAGTDYDKVGAANRGETLTLLAESKDSAGKLWYQIKTKTGATAWIASWYCQKNTGASNTVTGSNATISQGTGNTGSGSGTGTGGTSSNSGVLTGALPAANVGKVVYVTGDGVNLRNGAGTNYGSVGQVNKGESFTVLAVKNDTAGKAWYQVGIGDGDTAWIASWLTSTIKATSASDNTSTGELTAIREISVQQDNRKTAFLMVNGEGNVYKMENVTDNSVQYLLDNVTVPYGQLTREWDGFRMTVTDIGDNRARMNVIFEKGSYVNLEQKGDTLHVDGFHTSRGLAGKVIVLDPGHGGSDVGAIGYSNKELTDADVGYTVSLKLKAMLEDAGATVYLTRGELPKTVKVTLAERMTMSNDIMPDIFISIHANSTASGTTQVSGAQTYTYNNPLYPQKPLSDALAEKIKDGINTTTQRDSVLKSDSLYVLRMNNHPSVLVETGFLNNLEDEALLATDEYRYRLAQGIFVGVNDYFNMF